MDAVSILGREPAMYIDGSWIKTDETQPVINPADESIVAEVPEADTSHVEQALEAARRAQRDWGCRSGPERGAALRRVAAGIRAHKEDLARLAHLSPYLLEAGQTFGGRDFSQTGRYTLKERPPACAADVYLYLLFETHMAKHQ